MARGLTQYLTSLLVLTSLLTVLEVTEGRPSRSYSYLFPSRHMSATQRRSVDTTSDVSDDMREVLSLLSLLSAMHQKRHLSDVIRQTSADVIRPSISDAIPTRSDDVLQLNDVMDRQKKRQRQCYFNVVACY